jgi:hypothetical protein
LSAIAILVLLLAYPAAGLVEANVCAHDAVPAASLLFPFLVFDYANPTAGMTSLISITNMSSQAQIVHLTLWSDTSVRVLDLDLLLSGYDVQTINLRDLLHAGILPVTGVEGELVVAGGHPETDGPVSHDDGRWLDMILPEPEGTDTLSTRCPPGSEHYPGSYASGLNGTELQMIASFLRASQLAGRLHDSCEGHHYTLYRPSWWEQWSGVDPTWFYITADVVKGCSGLFPDQPDYWASQASYNNVLTGDIFWIDDAQSFSQGAKAVHLEADPQIAEVATLDPDGNPATFAYRYSTRNHTRSDYREPLPTAWSLRYIGAGSTAIDTYIRVWKGSTFFPRPIDLEIAGDYLSLSCLAYTYWAWDADEGVYHHDECPGSCPPRLSQNLLPLAAQEIPVDDLNTPGEEGWLLFVWPASNFADPYTADQYTANPVPDWYQTWMGVRYSAFGRFSTFIPGTVMASYNCYSDQVVPKLGIGYDYVDGQGHVSSPRISEGTHNRSTRSEPGAGQ